ncbi:MAG: methylated-DNA--[protein]-cysteine S-methyltransferase [Methylotenera sp.]
MTTDDAMIQTPFGAVAVSVHNTQLAIELLVRPPSDSVVLSRQSAHPLVMEACQQIMTYLQNPHQTFNIPLSQHGTTFQQRVWQAIAAIPCGQVRTYGELANAIGSGPRAVANACGANNLPLVVPCHRVVAQSGLGGFMQGQQGGLRIKQWLLQHEGVHL